MQCAFSARSLKTFSPDRIWSAKIHAGVRRARYPQGPDFCRSQPALRSAPCIQASKFRKDGSDDLGQSRRPATRSLRPCHRPTNSSGMSSLTGGASDLRASAGMVFVLLSRQARELRNDCLTPVLDSQFPSHRGRSDGARSPSPCAIGSLASSSRAVSVLKNVAVSD